VGKYFKRVTPGLCLSLLLIGGACSSSSGTHPDGGGTGGGGGSTSVTTLPAAVHVASGSDAASADGTEAHPFATLLDADVAIIAHPSWTGDLIVHPGTGRYEVTKDAIIPKSALLKVLPGVTFAMGPGINIHAQNDVKVQGEPGNPVTFTWLVANSHWGSFTNFEPTSVNNLIEYAIFEHGGETSFNGFSMRGALSIRTAGGRFAYNEFRFNEGDDGFNIRASTSVIEFSYFHDNNNDCLDSDVAGANGGFVEVRFNHFEHCGNDAVDLGEGSTAYIHDNVMLGSGDKGVSIGESSAPRIDHNLIVGCNLGMGIKDSSEPVISFNTLYANDVGVAIYEGITGRGSGHGSFSNGIIWKSGSADVVNTPDGMGVPGTTTFAYSCIQSGVYRKDLEATSTMTYPLAGAGILTAAAGCADPMFAQVGTIPPVAKMLGTSIPDPGDYHLKSAAGRFVANTGTDITDGDIAGSYVTTDTTTSPCLDKADPAAAFTTEPTPNGGRADLGTYGASKYASKSPI
jgi:parallel beta-helix repeat protein